MKVTQEKLPDSQIGLEIEVPADISKQTYEQTLRKYMKAANIPGYRKGKVPRQILVQQLGATRLKAAALEELIQTIIDKAIAQEKIEALGNYQLRSGFETLIEEFEPGKSLIISASVDVPPQAELVNYQGLSVKAEEVKYNPERVLETLESYQQNLASLVPVEDRVAQEGDVAVVDFVGKISKEGQEPQEFEGGSATEFQVEIKEERFIPGFVEGIVGMELGQTKDVEVTFPEDYPQEDLAGKPAIFRITLNDLKERELPDIDDDLAQEVSEFETLEELKQSLEDRFQKEAADTTQANTEKALLDELVTHLQVEIPKTLLQREIDHIVTQTVMQLANQGIDVNKFLTKDLVSNMRENAEPEATERLKRTLALGEVAKQESISVDDKAVATRIIEMMSEVDNPADIDQDRLKQVVHEDLLKEKILDWLRERTTIELVSEGTLTTEETTGEFETALSLSDELVEVEEAKAEEHANTGNLDKIDPYLIHSFEMLDTTSINSEEENEFQLPMMVRVIDESWEPNAVPDSQVIFRLGQVFAIKGSSCTLEYLANDPNVVSVEASRPSTMWESKSLRLPISAKKITELPSQQPLKDSSQNLSLIGVDRIHDKSEKGAESIIAIIDSGIDILHESFLDQSTGKSRIIAIWDQTDDTGPSPNIPNALSIGTEYTHDEINKYVKSRQIPEKLGRDNSGHGTHVASIAAGKSSDHFSGGVAPKAKIILVKPKIESGLGDQYSLGYSITHGLALSYIKNIAQYRRLPVVVNVSQGMNAGAHDGTSLLESCFDTISNGGRDPGFVIVKSAGNERVQNNHAKFSIAKDCVECLYWESKPFSRPMDVIEIWFKSFNLFRFRLINPQGEKSDWVNANEKLAGKFRSDNSFSASYIRYHKDNGDSRILFTVSPGNSNLIEPGKWAIEIEGLDVEKTNEFIHAWIERDAKRSVSFINHQSQDITLSIPGTAKTVISVGSVNASKPFRIATYSSYGPTRDGRPQPDVAAPGEGITAALSGSDNNVCTKSGTSMAAPHVTGAIALLLSARHKQCLQEKGLEQFNAAQIRSAMCHVTQNSSGQWHAGMGYGVLDAFALLETLGCF